MAAVPQPSGTVTLVFTDIEGSTRLLEELGVEGYRAALAEHRRVVREACARYEGYEVDYEGDAFFYAFASAQQAVSAVAEAMAGLDGGPIRIRVGVHTGEPALDPPKYVGMDVHRAARLMSSAHGDQVLVSASAAVLLPHNDQSQGVVLRDLGEHRFKDLAAAERVYQLGEEEFPPIRSLYRSKLPVPATPFLGREQELAAVVEQLTDPATRLLTLTGPGGTGKTRLALQAAAEASDLFPDGVWWVPLAPLRDPALVLSAVAQALEIQEEPGRELADVLAARLGGKRLLLLLLDNLEHLLPDAAAAVAVLRDIGGPVVLVTSRERLQLQGEHEYPVETLADPDALELMRARAAALGVRVEGTSAVSELLGRLDRLPLAIELAAARLKLFSPEQLLERLGRRLDLLKGGRDADPRQQTLRATIEWSYQLLDPEEQRVFRALSVFAGGCTYEAAAEVADADPDTLQSLIDKSLVRRRDTPLGPRYWMLETIREFGWADLERRSEVAGVRGRHGEWFVGEAGMRSTADFVATTTRLQQLDADLGNHRDAFEHLASVDDGDRALRLACGLYPVWEMRALFAEGSSRLDRALELPSNDAVVRARALSGAAALDLHRGDDRRAEARAFESAELLRGAGVPGEYSEALAQLAWSRGPRDPEGARATASEALAAARASGEPTAIRFACDILAACELRVGEFESAASHFEEALAVSTALGLQSVACAGRHSLGDVDLLRGNYERATSCYLAAGRESVDLRTPHTLALCVGGLAAVAASTGKHDLAVALWAAVEAAEDGGSLMPTEGRDRYASVVGDVSPTVAPLSLEDALEVAAARMLPPVD